MESPFIFPGEGFELRHSLGVGPGGAAHGVDEEGDAGEDDGADNEDAYIHRPAAGKPGPPAGR